MKLKCRIGFHNWSLWSETYKERWIRTPSRQGVLIESLAYPVDRYYQNRRCQDCRIADRILIEEIKVETRQIYR